MPNALTIVVLVALVVIAALIVVVIARLASLAAARDAATREVADLRTRFEVLAATNAEFERDLRQDLANARTDQTLAAQGARTELSAILGQHAQTMREQLHGIAGAQNEQMKQVADRVSDLTKSNEQRLEAVRTTVEARLDVLRNENTQKLEQMRATVDEKLQTTLDERLGQSFKQVADRLEQVHKGLGDMQTLAIGVGDLKRVLTNVKRRGTWGEMQLGALLADVLNTGQYGTNVETIPGSGKRVEYAIRMPGRADEAPCWIPVDSKFPVEEWERLQDALERADGDAAETARRALSTFVRQQAKTIRDNYVAPPHTSDFAFLFLPTESLYAEMMARTGLAEELQRGYRVTIAGPSNFLALLNIVQMGFRTVAIEQRSKEVWHTLSAVRTEFGKFGDVLARAQKKLLEASNTIDEARGKTTTIARKLKDVELLPDAQARDLLGFPLPDIADDEPSDVA
jgi:DNA recombination protein RmuC